MNPRRLASLLPLKRVRGGYGSIAAKVSAGLVAGIMAVSCAVAPAALAAEPVGPNPWEGYVTGPRQPISVESIRYQINHPHERFMPEGVNDPNCKLTPEHAEPVVLLHGTESEIYRDYALLGPTLRDEGWCVFALEYGGRNTPESGSTARREGPTRALAGPPSRNPAHRLTASCVRYLSGPAEARRESSATPRAH